MSQSVSWRISSGVSPAMTRPWFCMKTAAGAARFVRARVVAERRAKRLGEDEARVHVRIQSTSSPKSSCASASPRVAAGEHVDERRVGVDDEARRA